MTGNDAKNHGSLNDPRVYLAAERTYLAWVRTGLALMGFGFVVARFGLLMRELRASAADISGPAQGLSTRFGTGLVMLGVVFTATAILRYIRLLKRLERGEVLYSPSRLAIALGLALSVLGGVVAIYLLMTS